MAKATQEKRVLNLSTPLGKDFLLINELTAQERISELYEYEMEILYDEENNDNFKITRIDPKDILGRPINVSLNQPNGPTRFFNGIVNQLIEIGRNRVFSVYRAKVVPNIWKLTQSFQSRIFQHISVTEILEEVLEGFEYRLQTRRTYKPRNFCMQYQESDFDFISRLMEEEGIYFYFEQEKDREIMVIRDDYSTPVKMPGLSTIPIFSLDNQSGVDWEPSILSIHFGHTLKSGKVTVWDYNFQMPKKKLDSSKMSSFDGGGNREMETYKFPGGFAGRYDAIDKTGNEDSKKLNQLFEDTKHTTSSRILSMDSEASYATGTSDCCTLTPGYLFNLKNHPNKEINTGYIVLSVNHSVSQSPSYVSEDATETEKNNPYKNEFTCTPHGQGNPEYRPPARTPRPVMQGTQTAFVVGPKGEEIYTDKYGRVKVQFHWDRDNKNDANSACWIRVAKDSAGNKYGSMYIPRIGQEVIVDFIGGDPDQPIITGSVYNAEQMPHYELPKYKTLSYIKTRTSPDDGQGFNELRFEDKKGKEQVFIHSQKRGDIRIKSSFYETCGGNRQERIGVRSDNKPGGNLAITVGGNHDLHVKEDQYSLIDGVVNEAVGGDVLEDYQGDQKTKVANGRELSARSIKLEATQSITLKVGGNFIVIDPSGITIKGMLVKINSGGSGSGTSSFKITDPFDAESADTGEPGYLDRPRTGGGRRTRNTRLVKPTHFRDTTELNDLMNEAKSLESNGKIAEAANTKQDAIDEAIKVYNIDTSKTTSVKYDSSVSGEAVTTSDGKVSVGDDAFRDPAWLGSSVAHETEIHVSEQAKKGNWYNGTQGTAIQEVEAYDHEIANGERFGTSEENMKDLKKRRKKYYDSLSSDNKARVDGDPPDYTLKAGEEGT